MMLVCGNDVGDATTSSEPYDKVTSVDEHSSSPVRNPAGENQENETYKSSLTTVALCVSNSASAEVSTIKCTVYPVK